MPLQPNVLEEVHALHRTRPPFESVTKIALFAAAAVRMEKEMQIPSLSPFSSREAGREGPSSFHLLVPFRREICASSRNSVKIETNETEEDLVGGGGEGEATFRHGGCRDTGELFQMEGRKKEREKLSVSHTPLSYCPLLAAVLWRGEQECWVNTRWPIRL